MKCKICEKVLPLDCFYNDKSKKSGKKPRCKKCDLLSIDKERRKKYEKEYWSKSENKNRKKVIVKKSHKKHKEKIAKTRREYLQSDVGIAMHRRHSQKRYALEKNAFIENVSPFDLFNEQDGICYICEVKFKFKEMELDHILPLAKNGKHEKINCKMACVFCNRSKGAKLLSEVMYQMV